MIEGCTTEGAAVRLGRAGATHSPRERLLPKLRRIAAGNKREPRFAKLGLEGKEKEVLGTGFSIFLLIPRHSSDSIILCIARYYVSRGSERVP